MFNKDFYPTPDEVIHEMVKNLDLSGKTVLEPSAGKGNIIDFLHQLGAKVVCCELNEDLAIISGSKAKLIGKDFLDIQSDQISHVQYIVMNPPFSADDTHINHAWDIAPPGCEIISLCNYETIRNEYTKSRKILNSTIQNYGSFENIGDVFSSAERKTDVVVGLVRLTKPGSAQNFAEYFSDEDDDSEHQENGIMSYNAVRDVVQRYVNAIKLYDQVIENAVKMNELTSGLRTDDIVFTCTRDKAKISREDFAKELQKKSWGWVISKMNLQKYSTRGLQDDINRFVEQQKSAKFTMKNIYLMLEAVIQTAGQRMDKAMIEVFDNLTNHYHENRWNLEGWKTNSHYLVNKKFIFPYVAPVSRWGNYPDINSRKADELDDLTKALCYITGENYESFERFYQSVGRRNFQYGEWFDWGFFELKLFKKGTAHFKFKSENVWARFNQNIARIKGFPLPEKVK